MTEPIRRFVQSPEWTQAAAILRGAREKLTPITWIQGRMFGRHVGDTIEEVSIENADSWCATGSIDDVCAKLVADENAKRVALGLLTEAIGGSIEGFNDEKGRTLGELHAKIDEAIAAAERGRAEAITDEKAEEIGGYASTLTGGYASTLTGGDASTLTGGYASTLTGGDASTLTGGDASTLTGGDASTLTGGNRSTLLIRWWDGRRYRIAAFNVGEDGIEPNVAYRCEAGKLVRVAAEG